MKQRQIFARILEQKGLTSYALAKMIGYKPQTVYNWVYGHGTPEPAVMLKIMKILDISAEEILKMFAEEATEGGK